MQKVLIAVVLALLATPGVAQNPSCLRIYPLAELTRESSMIARARVTHIDRVNYKGSYGQIAQLQLLEVIDGDVNQKLVNVLAQSRVQCAEDNYAKGQEVLVFLMPVDSLLRTVDFQYGQFLIEADIVHGWRDKANKPCDKPYAEVHQEIEEALNAAQPPRRLSQSGSDEAAKAAIPALWRSSPAAARSH